MFYQSDAWCRLPFLLFHGSHPTIHKRFDFFVFNDLVTIHILQKSCQPLSALTVNLGDAALITKDATEQR